MRRILGQFSAVIVGCVTACIFWFATASHEENVSSLVGDVAQIAMVASR
ncbi:MAG: hypothetical protein KF841_10430 [Phycisphaerae bacterium]|nr:hypothetical protein [Phycisphaerae bacterium]